MAAVEYGVMREVAFAPLDDPSAKKYFLVRDDAGTKSGAVFARTYRMDKPINPGPGSGWQQLSWEGGMGQTVWRDEYMYERANADVFTRTGKIRMWPGWDAMKKDATRTFDSYSMAASGSGANFQESRLYFAERSRWSAATPSGGFKAMRYNPASDTVEELTSTNFPDTLSTRGFTAICAATDDSSSNIFVYFGTANGLWVYNETGDAWTKDTGYAAGKQVQYDSMVSYKDALYYCAGKKFCKRTPLPPYGVIGTHTDIKDHKASANTMGLTVWNNRLWYGVQYQGNRVAICTSDGVTAAEAFTMPEEFVITGLHAHYGALYIFGGKPQADPGSAAHPASIGEVWRYSGSSLVKLWDSNDEELGAIQDGRAHVVMKGCSWGSLLAWPVSGWGTGPENYPGVMFYDPEKDALFMGPSIPTDPSGMQNHGVLATGLCSWDGTLALGFRDNHSYVPNGAVGVDRPKGIMVWRQNDKVRNRPNLRQADTFKGRSVEQPANVMRQFLLSSCYHGLDNVANEEKVWLSGRVNVKLPTQWTRIKVYAITNHKDWDPPVSGDPTLEADPAATLVTTLSFDSTHTGFHRRTFDMKLTSEDEFIRSEKLQLAFVLENLRGGDLENDDQPEVDVAEVQYMVLPERRFQWRMRLPCYDAQLRLDETPNTLDTATELVDALEDFWSTGEPFYMWGPHPSDADSGTQVTVMPLEEGFNSQTFRLHSLDDEEFTEVSLTLVEHT